MTTENMGLETIESGYAQYTWATAMNTNFSIIDEHDHSEGSGAILQSSIIQILRDFEIGEGITGCSYLSALNLDSPYTTVSNSMSSVNGNYTYIDGKGRRVQLTSGSSLNTTNLTGGGFSGDYVDYGAECYYDQTLEIYNFTTDGSVLTNVYSDRFNLSNITITPTTTEGVQALNGIVSATVSNIDFNFPSPVSGTSFLGLTYSSGVWTAVSQSTPVISVTSSSDWEAISNKLKAYNGTGYRAAYSATDFTFMMTEDNYNPTYGKGYCTAYVANTFFSHPTNNRRRSYCAPFLFEQTVEQFQSGLSYALGDLVLSGQYGITGLDEVYGMSSFFYCPLPVSSGDQILRVTMDQFNYSNVVTQVNPTYPGSLSQSYATTSNYLNSVEIQQLFLPLASSATGNVLQEFVCLSQGSEVAIAD